jgi:hypothetical protein
MDLTYSAEYERFRAEVRAFLDQNWTEADRNSTPPPDSQASLMGSAIRNDDRATVRSAEEHHHRRRVSPRQGTR